MRKLLLLPTLATLLLAPADALGVPQKSPRATAATVPTATDEKRSAAVPTLTVNKREVTYGGAVSFTGSLPTAAADQKVTLRGEVLRPDGTKEASAVAETTTDGAGGFAFASVPTAQTTYTAVLQGVPSAGAASKALTVRVAPRLGFALVRKVGNVVTFSAKATSAIPYVGRYVVIQRTNALGQWVVLKRVVLRSNTVPTRAFARLPEGLSRLRVLMPRSQVGVGYVAGVSRVILVRL
jgi:hypothetical protein